MPAKSKAQARFFRAVAAGDVKAPGLSKKKAHEYVAGHKTRDLPERKMPKKDKKDYMEKMTKGAGGAASKATAGARKAVADPKSTPRRKKKGSGRSARVEYKAPTWKKKEKKAKPADNVGTEILKKKKKVGGLLKKFFG